MRSLEMKDTNTLTGLFRPMGWEKVNCRTSFSMSPSRKSKGRSQRVPSSVAMTSKASRSALLSLGMSSLPLHEMEASSPLHYLFLLYSSAGYLRGVFVSSVDLKFIKCVWELLRNLSRESSKEGCPKCQEADLLFVWVCALWGCSRGRDTDQHRWKRPREAVSFHNKGKQLSDIASCNCEQWVLFSVLNSPDLHQ